MDKDFIKRYGLTESQKKFKQLCEYTFINSTLSEDDENSDNNEIGSEENSSNIPDSQNNIPPSPTQDNTSQNDSQDNQNLGNVEAQNDVNSQNSQIPQDGSLSNAINNIDNSDNEEDNEEDEYVDVEELTDAQEESEKKIDYTNKKIKTVISKIDSFITAIQNNDKKIEDLEKELKLRVPTQDERLNLRSQDSYPFSIKPKEYWDNKNGSNYNVMYNNDVSTSDEDKEYEIKRGDLNGDSSKTIYDTFDDLEDGLDLNKIFNY